MRNLSVTYPVMTIGGRTLLPAGAELSEETLRELMSSRRPGSIKSYPLLAHGTIGSDIVEFINTPPYNIIFENNGHGRDVMDIMETFRFARPVLDALDYFKEYDLLTYRHMLTVFALTIKIAQELVPDYQNRVSEIAYGPTHDFGKVSVPLDILRKKQPLTRAEHDHLKHHSLAGYLLLSYYFGSSRVIAAKVARDHHERRNGSGYPRGIKQEDLLVEIVAVCDIYDALISSRPYRPVCYDNRTALEELTLMAKRGEIGWEVVRALIACNRRNKPGYQDVPISEEVRGTPPPGNIYGKRTEE